MPQLERELAGLVAIPSISALDYPEETRPALLEAHDAVAALFREPASSSTRSSCRRPRRSSPARSPRRRARRPCCSTATTTSCRRATSRSGSRRRSRPTERDGAIFGRGSADTKSNILMHVGALRAWEGRPPVGIKIVIEGQEEVGQRADDATRRRTPSCSRSDAMVIGDMGSVRPGVPTLTIGLRGMADRRRSRSRRSPARSTAASSAARRPTRCSRCSARWRRCTTSTATSPSRGCGARSGPARRTARTSSATLAEVEPGCRSSAPAGSARASGRARRSRSRASTCSSVDGARQRRRRRTRAPRSALRVHPEQDAAEAQAALIRAPRGAAAVRDRARGRAGRDRQRVLRRHVGPGLRARRARRCAAAWGGERRRIAATGGSIPLVSALQRGGARRRDAAARHDRRLRQHPRAERARAARRVREGRRSPRPSSSAATRASFESMSESIVTSAPAAMPEPSRRR